MAPVHIVRVVSRPLEGVWAALSDVRAHARFVPLSWVTTDPGPAQVGWRFAVLTGVGRFHVADTMVLESWEPPTAQQRFGRLSARKTGRALAGYADILVQEIEPGRTKVEWTEQVRLRPARLGALLSPVVDPAAAIVFGRIVDGLLEGVPE